MKLKDIKKNIKGVFKLPKKRYYFGKVYFGAPYFFPWGYCSSIINIRKDKYLYVPSKHFKLFGYYIYYGSPIVYRKLNLGWKDKFGTPRHEWDPGFYLYFFNLQFCIWWSSPYLETDVVSCENEKYWEMVLWYLHYSDKDIKKAEKTWAWIGYETKKSTWDNKVLIKK